MPGLCAGRRALQLVRLAWCQHGRPRPQVVPHALLRRDRRILPRRQGDERHLGRGVLRFCFTRPQAGVPARLARSGARLAVRRALPCACRAPAPTPRRPGAPCSVPESCRPAGKRCRAAGCAPPGIWSSRHALSAPARACLPAAGDHAAARAALMRTRAVAVARCCARQPPWPRGPGRCTVRRRRACRTWTASSMGGARKVGAPSPVRPRGVQPFKGCHHQPTTALASVATRQCTHDRF